MTVDKYEPIYPFRAESFTITTNPANTNDWYVSEKLEDKFYGYGFVDSPNAPSPECVNDVYWYSATEQEIDSNVYYQHNTPLYVLQMHGNNKPIC